MSLTPLRIQKINAAIETECPVCQCQMITPTAIPACGHKFCFTCLKGVCMNDMGCPMCRGPIDPTIFNLPSQVLDLKMKVPLSPAVTQNLNKSKLDQNNVAPISLDLNASLNESQEENMYWLYRGKNQGWWRFDPRHERDIDQAFNSNQNHCEVLICGRTYIIDFDDASQYPKDAPTQRREVKRVSAADFDQMGVKGLAGVFAAKS